jgi:cell division protein WhiA
VSRSEELRNELAAIEPRRECDRLAELSALFHTAGRIHLRGGGEIFLHLDVASSPVARRAFRLLRSFGIESEIRTYRQRAFARATRYQLHVPGEPRALQVLHEAGVVTARLAPLARPPKRVVRRSCCRGAYLRGALLGAGSLTGPPSPHLEIRSDTREGAEQLAEIAADEGIQLAVLERARHAVAYAKGLDTIAAVLATAGAGDAVVALQERAVMGSTKGRANRLANADHANLARSSRAAHAQLRAVRRLEERGRLDALPGPLREIARLRKQNPSLSVRELALKCKPPAAKATAHRRLRKLIGLAEL